MQIDLRQYDAGTTYRVLASLVTPRPIALITTIDLDGKVNAAPYSFFNILGSDPALVGFGPARRSDGSQKDTEKNARQIGEFVVNLIEEPLLEKMALCSASLPAGQSELDFAGLTSIPSKIVQPPRIAEAPVSLECQEHTTLEIGNNTIILATVSCVHVRDGVLDPQTLRLAGEYAPLGRMGGPDAYCRTKDVLHYLQP